MSFLPNTAIKDIETIESDKEYIDFLLDKNTMRFTTIGNQKESLKNWIEWAIRINRYKYEIFPYNYGNELYDELLGKNMDEEEKRDLVEFCIIDAIKPLQWIDDVEVSNIEFNGTKVSCRVIVKTLFGEEIEDEYNI